MSEQLALEWLPQRIDALAPNGKTARLETVDHLDSRISTIQAGEMLRAWLEREGFNGKQAVVVLPRESVVVRRLSVPECPPNELPDLVRFQAAIKTSASIESMALDFLPVRQSAGGEGQTVITVVIDRDRLARIQTICEAAGLEITRITLSSLCIGGLLKSAQASDLGTAGADLVLYQQGSRLELSIFDEGTLIFSHDIRLPEDVRAETLKPLTTELTRSFVALSQVRPDASVLRCFYVSGSPHPAIQKLLVDRYGAALTVTSPEQAGRIKIPQGYEVLAGALLGVPDPELSLDLLHPRKKYEAPDRRRLYASLAAAAAVLIVVVGISTFYYQKSQLNSQIALLQDEVNKQKEQLNKGKPRLLAHSKIASWAEGDSEPLELWAAFRQQLPSTSRAYFVEVKVHPVPGELLARFTGRGQARDRVDIEALNQSLSDAGYRVRPTTPTLGKRDPDYPWQFELIVELPRLPRAMPGTRVPATAKPTADRTRTGIASGSS